MSHSAGKVRFKDGKIMFYEYNGTIDACISHIYDSSAEMSKNWRKHAWNICSCGGEEQVEIYSGYGDGFYFKGRACRQCKSLQDTSLTHTDYNGFVEDDYDVVGRKYIYDDWANEEEI